MKIRIYVAPMITEDVPDLGTVYKSKVNDFIDVGAGDGFQDYIHYRDTYSVVFCWASDAAHAAIIADTEITALSPFFDDQNDFKSKLGLQWAVVPESIRITAINRLEAIGVNTEWITDTNTVRDVYRYVLKVITFGQVAVTKHSEIAAFIKSNLTTKVKDLPQVVRDKVSTWMQNRGLAIGWITNQSTVREIVNFIVNNLGIGTLKFLGEDF